MSTYPPDRGRHIRSLRNEEFHVQPTPQLPTAPQCLAHSGIVSDVAALRDRVVALEEDAETTDARVAALAVELAVVKESVRPWLSAISAGIGAAAVAIAAWFAAGGSAP